MPRLNITVANRTASTLVAHVYDTLTGGTRAVEGSPFVLAPGGRSTPFGVNADRRGHGILAYRCESGLTLAGLDVTDGACIDLGP